MGQHPELKTMLTTWTKAVFLLLSVGDSGENTGGCIAVSTSQPIPEPPHDIHLSPAELHMWKALKSAPSPGMPGFRIRHYDGGPLDRASPLAIAHVPLFSRISSVRMKSVVKGRAASVQCISPSWIFGRVEDVIAIVQEAAVMPASAATVGAASAPPSPNETTINIVWGYGGWGVTQALAEIGRGGWGLVSADSYLALHPDAALEISWDLDFEWSRMVEIAKIPPPSEYSRHAK